MGLSVFFTLLTYQALFKGWKLNITDWPKILM